MTTSGGNNNTCSSCQHFDTHYCLVPFCRLTGKSKTPSDTCNKWETMSKLPNLKSMSHKLEFYDSNGRIALTCHYGNEVYGKLTVNQPETPLEDNEFIVKNYSENEGWALAYINSHPELFLPTTFEVQISQWVTCPIYRVTKKFITDEFEATYNKRSDLYEAHPTLWSLYDNFVQANKQ